MVMFKWTMIFTYQSGITATNTAPIRTGGWSESYYTTAYNDAARLAWFPLIDSRLSICPRGTSVTRWRVQQVDPTLGSSLKKTARVAPNTWLSDVPQMAAKVQFGSDQNAGAFYREFRGMPDVQVITGEYQPTAPFVAAMSAFLDQLKNSPFRARRRVKTNPQFRIQSIAVGGIVTMIEDTAGIALGTRVQVLRGIDPTTGRKRGFFATVSSFTTVRNFTVSGPDVKVLNFGTIRVAAVETAQFSAPDTDNIEAVVRKVGRPFKAYSGRASKR